MSFVLGILRRKRKFIFVVLGLLLSEESIGLFVIISFMLL